MAVLITVTAALPTHADDNIASLAVEPIQRVPLSSGQALALAQLDQIRPQDPAPLFLFTDPNKDPDDLIVLVQAKYLQEHGFIDLRCVLTTLGDQDTRTTRARFAKAVLDELRLQDVKVGVGTDYKFEVRDANGVPDTKATEARRHDHRVFIDTPLLAPLAAVETDGFALLKEELERLPDRSTFLLINAGMADPAVFLRRAPDLVRSKAAKVVIMGGVEPWVDERGFLVADKRSYNNTTDQPSADYVYARVQELGLPLVVVNKEATYRVAVPKTFYDGMATTGHPIGIYLRDQQRQSLSHLWEGIHKERLPPALTPEWFFRTFTDADLKRAAGRAALANVEAHPENFDTIWGQVSKFNQYDPLALLAATPGVAELAFRKDTPAGATGKVQLIGKNSIKDATFIKDLLTALGIESLHPRPLP